jgi:hypothetical protein
MLVDMEELFWLYLDRPAGFGRDGPATHFATGPVTIPRDVAE